MRTLKPESRDFFARRLSRELVEESHRSRALFTVWIVAILVVIVGSATIGFGS